MREDPTATVHEAESPVREEPRKKRGRPSMRDLRKANNGKSFRLSEEKTQQMFTLYCNVPNFSYISRVAGVSMSTVRKCYIEHNWEQRREEIVAEARKLVDYDLAKATEDSIRILRRAKEKIEAKIDKLAEEDMNPAFLITDLERLVKMEQVLLGGVTDRTERINYSHEERIRKLREEKARVINPHVKGLSQPGATLVLEPVTDEEEPLNGGVSRGPS